MADYLENHEEKKIDSIAWYKSRLHEGFRYKDYLAWGEGIRVEMLGGMVYLMASPTVWHQRMVLGLGRQLDDFFNNKPCKPFIAPLDVRLFPQDDLCDTTVVQPDVLVVCDESKIDRKGIFGAPDFIIEIMSEYSEGHDKITKRKLYEQAGVREYWIVAEDKICAPIPGCNFI